MTYQLSDLQLQLPANMPTEYVKHLSLRSIQWFLLGPGNKPKFNDVWTQCYKKEREMKLRRYQRYRRKKKHRGNKDQEERTNKLHSCDLQLAHARPTLPCIHLVVEFATATHLTVSLSTPLSLSLLCTELGITTGMALQ